MNIKPLSEQERAQLPREVVLEHDLAAALAERRGPRVGDPDYRSGGDAAAKLHDERMADSRRRHERGQDTHIITVTEPGYDVVLFFNEDGGAEAVISRPNDKPTGVNIAPPAPGRHIVVERIGERFQVVYRDARK